MHQSSDISFEVFIQPAHKGSYPTIEIPAEIADPMLGETKLKRIVLQFDKGPEFHRALRRHKDGYAFIALGKSTMRDAKKEAGITAIISLREDNSEYGMPMPEELKEVLRQDEEGYRLFEELKPGLRRSLLYYVVSAKSVDTRIKRSLKLMENLKTGRYK